MEVVVRPVPAAATRPLRLAVLRPDQPAQAAVYPGDDDGASVHLGAVAHGDGQVGDVQVGDVQVGDGQIVGIASLYAEARTGGPSPAWRLRGMATAPSARGAGVGAALLRACVEQVAARGGGELWCNARVSASGFYARHGFEVVGERFEIEDIGPHEVMRRAVTAGPAVVCDNGRS